MRTASALSVLFVGLGALELALPEGAHQSRVDHRHGVSGLVQRQGDALGIGAGRFECGVNPACGNSVCAALTHLTQPQKQKRVAFGRVGKHFVARLARLACQQRRVERGFGYIDAQIHGLLLVKCVPVFYLHASLVDASSVRQNGFGYCPTFER
jgi:hypothetical protein